MPKRAAGPVLHVNFAGKIYKLFQRLDQEVKLLLSLQFYNDLDHLNTKAREGHYEILKTHRPPHLQTWLKIFLRKYLYSHIPLSLSLSFIWDRFNPET